MGTVNLISNLGGLMKSDQNDSQNAQQIQEVIQFVQRGVYITANDQNLDVATKTGIIEAGATLMKLLSEAYFDKLEKTNKAPYLRIG